MTSLLSYWVNSTHGPHAFPLFTDLESAKAFLVIRDKLALMLGLTSVRKLLAPLLPEMLKDIFRTLSKRQI